MTAQETKLAKRILEFLNSGMKCCLIVLDDAGTKRNLLQAANGGKMLVKPEILDTLHKAGLADRSGDTISLSVEGKKKVARLLATDDPFSTQHRKLTRKDIVMDGAKHQVTVNENESPLQRLRKRKTRNGNPWLDAEHFEAGERLRRDFTVGQLMQKVSSNWDFSSSGSRKSGAGGKADLTDQAMDARDRLHKALELVGPDLATVLTDVCCFLKGLENVEREQRWPPRSAKLMLRTGLELLARHYGTRTGVNQRSSMRMWGGEGYRPELNIR